jgi:hypothetical protein
VDGDGKAEIITGAGPGGGPHMKVFSGADLGLLFSFYAYHATFSGGVFVGAGDINGDGRRDVISGAGAGGGPHVKVFNGQDAEVLQSFYAYHPLFGGGVRVAAADVNGDGRDDVITGAGPGGGPHVRAFSGLDLAELASFYAYDVGFSGGVFVAGAPSAIQGAAMRLAGDQSSRQTSSAVTSDVVVSITQGGDGTRSVPATLELIHAAALARWREVGLSAERIDRLSRVRMQWVDLPDDLLGLATVSAVLIDRDAAGRDSFVDPTPMEDEELLSRETIDGRVDLLTVVLHELAHALGLDHSDGGLMDHELNADLRQLPGEELVEAVYGQW